MYDECASLVTILQNVVFKGNLEKKFKEQSNDVLTNNRKTYYEDQNITSLNSIYYYILLIIYIHIIHINLIILYLQILK